MSRLERTKDVRVPPWQFLQCFGERSPGEEVQDADIISAVEFDKEGTNLATGDHGGRVVLFEAVAREQMEADPEERPCPSSSRGPAFEYQYSTEFQSHEPEFDYLKSLEIEEKINKVRWCPSSNGAQFLLSTNDKAIKLWKVYEKRVDQMANFNVEASERKGIEDCRALDSSHLDTIVVHAGKMKHKQPRQCLPTLRIPRVLSSIMVPAARCKRLYANGHAYHINSLSLNSDCETFMSADDLRINLWHMDRADQGFNIVDLKPENMEDLTEVITSSDFHPTHCSIFAFSSSKGCLRVGDMRDRALCDRHSKVFEESGQDVTKSFFSEIINSMSHIQFGTDGRHIVSRDYMTIKVWDISMESGPIATFQVHEPLQGKLCDLYENDAIFDKFDCALSSSGRHIATGTYGHCFRIFDTKGEDHLMLEASKIPYRPMVAGMETTTSVSGRGMPSFETGVETDLYEQLDTNQKMLHVAWHPKQRIIATAASNSLYLFASP